MAVMDHAKHASPVKAYRRMLAQAARAARRYTGSEATYTRLMQAGAAVDDFVAQQGNGSRTALERSFALHAGLRLQTVDDVLGLATRGFNASVRVNPSRALERGGAVVIHANLVFLPTHGPGPQIGRGDRGFEPPVFQNRYALLLEGLQRRGIHTDDLIVYEGRLQQGQMRKKPYTLIDIPRLGGQIAVCDQVGEGTLVSTERLPLNVWTRSDKDALKLLPCVHPVKCDDTESWFERIWHHLSGQGLGRKVNVQHEAATPSPRRAFPLSEDFIVHHARLHRDARGDLPNLNSGPVEGLEGETWGTWQSALMQGLRGLPGESSLRKLFVAKGLKQDSLLLSEDFIVHHARLYRDARGDLPNLNSGPVEGFGGETWGAWNAALVQGCRGLPGESSLHKLLVAKGLKQGSLPLSEDFIVHHARLYLKARGDLPNLKSGSVEGLEGETWGAWGTALVQGHRGLPGESSLRKLFVAKGLKQDSLPLSEDFIVHHARLYLKARGDLPNLKSGPVEGLEGETWGAWEIALVQGYRGLPGESSLHKLLVAQGLKREVLPLSEDFIVHHARLHREARGHFPHPRSGNVEGLEGETWGAWEMALVRGHRGLSGESSLHKLFVAKGLKQDSLPLSEEFILYHARLYLKARGDLPNLKSGPVEGLEGETWTAWDVALLQGHRGLPGGSSLHRLWVERGLETPITLDGVRQAVRDHQKANEGKLPRAGTGPIPGLGRTWAGVDRRFRHGSHSFPQYDDGLTGFLVAEGFLAEKPKRGRPPRPAIGG